MIFFDKFLPFKGGIKLISEYVVRKTARVDSISARNDMAKIVKWSSSKFNSIAVPAFNFKELRDYGGFYEYSYDMPRMGKLNKDQKNIIKFISDNVNPKFDSSYRNIFNPNILTEKEKQLMDEWWDNHRDLMLFCLSIIKENKYHDFHEGNVMVYPDTEEFRLIDLEGFIVGKYDINWVNDCIINNN